MKYCNNCLLPDSRPGLIIENDGIHNACKTHFLKWIKLIGKIEKNYLEN